MRSSPSSTNRGILIPLLLLLLIWSGSALGSTPPTAEPASLTGARIAVLPLDNLSGAAAPLRELRAQLAQVLAGRGVDLLDDAPLGSFLDRHRVRYTGGVDTPLAANLRTEEKVGAVLVVNLELYDDSTTPKIALMARLVSTSATPEILWMESFSLAGHEAPGLFGLGLVEDVRILQQRVMASLADSLFQYLAGAGLHGGVPAPPRPFPPRIAFGQEVATEGTPLVAVLPFFNESNRRYASDILLLHFVHHLHADGRFHPVEPGLIREKMLAMRIILKEGVSVAQADLIANNLQTDFVLTGRVFSYQDVEGAVATPRVDFSSQMMERVSKRVIWTSKSYNQGDEGVWFYDWRRIYTASRLAGGMVKEVVRLLGTDTRPKAVDRAEEVATSP